MNFGRHNELFPAGNADNLHDRFGFHINVFGLLSGSQSPQLPGVITDQTRQDQEIAVCLSP
jgi:hypothetical protein